MKTKLKFDTAWLDSIQTLGDAEQGRLLRAYILYALGEALPELKGNERYVWGTIKAGVDEMNRRSEIYRENGKKRNSSAIAQQFSSAHVLLFRL